MRETIEMTGRFTGKASPGKLLLLPILVASLLFACKQDNTGSNEIANRIIARIDDVLSDGRT